MEFIRHVRKHGKEHLKKHWATKKGKVSIIGILLFSVLIIYGIISFLFTFRERVLSNTSTVTPLSEAALSSTHMHRLSGDEFAIVTKSKGKPSGKSVTHAIALSNGQTYTLDTDQNTIVNFIDGTDNSMSYVNFSPDVTIHKKDEVANNTSGKIDPKIVKKLKNNTSVASVIIQFNVPYAKFYEAKQTVANAQDKQSKFTAVRDRVLSKFSGTSKKKRDLRIISGISADIDQQTLSQLAKNPDVKKVELDSSVTALLDTSVDQIHAKDVWGLVSGSGQPLTGMGEKIAIIDTGVDYTHTDLGGCLGTNCKVIGGYDFVNSDADPMDDMGHGTHVAATAAGKGLLNGVAPDAKIIAVKVLNSSGSGSWSQVIAGINYAVDPNGDGDTSDHADVASMSLGGSGNPDDSISLAVDNATAAGVVFTIAAGNSGPTASTIMSPGTARTAITVAASCKTAQIGLNSYCANSIASFSSRGPLVWNGVDLQKPDVAAPGVLICAARWGTSFATAPTCFDAQHIRISGTSMATPHVAGVAALIKEAYPNYTPDQVKQLLRGSAHSLGMSANDQGTGEVDVKAAIPISPSVSSSPSSWTFTTDPTKKLSVNKQTLAVTPTDSSITSLSVQYSDSIPGVSVTFSKSSLQVANLATDSLDATITVDNDMAKPGNYFTRISLLSNGVAKGIIPVFITIKPTLTVSQSDAIDYGIDAPTLTSWTSDIKTLTFTNLRTDVSQTLKVSSSTYATGITFKAPTSVTVPANSTVTADTQFVVDNAKVPNNIYTGTVNFSSASTTISVGTKFTKFFVLIVQDTNATDLAYTFPVTVHASTGTVYSDYSTNSPKTFYVSEAGTYDVVARYYYPPSKYADITVVKEGITVSSAQTTVNVSVSDATNLVQVNPVDSSGQLGQAFAEDLNFTYGQLPMYHTFGGVSETYYMSNMSSIFGPKLVIWGPQPALKVHYYYYAFAGLTGNRTLTNAASDFKPMYTKWDVDQQTGSILPVIFVGSGGLELAVYSSNQSLTVPFTQTILATTPSEYKYFVWRYVTGAVLNSDVSPMFQIDNSLTRTTFYGSTLPNMTEPVVYQGLGPSVWVGKFLNSKTSVNIASEVYTALGVYIGFDTAAFLRQDYSSKPYPEQPFSINKDSALVYSGILPSFESGTYANWQTVTLPAAGVYNFQTDFPYKAKGLDMVGKVRATFDTNNTDANPPAFKRLYYFANNTRSEVYDPGVENKVEFELDPVGGTLGAVTVSFSPDGQTFQPVTVTNNGAVFDAILPKVATSKATIMISAKDSANNMLSYTFELPNGVAPVAVVSPAPTAVPTVTPTPTPTVAVTPNPIPVVAFASVQTTNETASQALITWNTVSSTSAQVSVPGTTQVKYGLSKTALTLSSAFNSTLISFHSVTLTNLAPRTTYYYQVLSNNSWGYPYASTVYSFKTKNR